MGLNISLLMSFTFFETEMKYHWNKVETNMRQICIKNELQYLDVIMIVGGANMTEEEIIELGKLQLGKLLLNIMEFQIVMVHNLDTDESIIGNEQFIFEKKPEWHRMLVCGICYDQEKAVFKINISKN